MSMEPEIDKTLGWLGSVEPPPGLEQRVHQRLQSSRSRPFFSRTRAISMGALAASIALSAVLVNPSLRSMAFHHGSTASTPLVAPRVALPAAGGFGTASAVHVPTEPVQVQPTPINQGRGRSRGRAVLPGRNAAPLPRGVAAPAGGTSAVVDSAR
jgi:hypothetical protein